MQHSFHCADGWLPAAGLQIGAYDKTLLTAVVLQGWGKHRLLCSVWSHLLEAVAECAHGFLPLPQVSYILKNKLSTIFDFFN